MVFVAAGDVDVDLLSSSSIAVISAAIVATNFAPILWVGSVLRWACAASTATWATVALLRAPRALSHAASLAEPIRRNASGV